MSIGALIHMWCSPPTTKLICCCLSRKIRSFIKEICSQVSRGDRILWLHSSQTQCKIEVTIAIHLPVSILAVCVIMRHGYEKPWRKNNLMFHDKLAQARISTWVIYNYCFGRPKFTKGRFCVEIWGSLPSQRSSEWYWIKSLFTAIAIFLFTMAFDSPTALMESAWASAFILIDSASALALIWIYSALAFAA